MKERWWRPQRKCVYNNSTILFLWCNLSHVSFRFGILKCCFLHHLFVTLFYSCVQNKFKPRIRKNYSIIYQVAAEQKNKKKGVCFVRYIFWLTINTRYMLGLCTLCNALYTRFRLRDDFKWFKHLSILDMRQWCMSMGPIKNHHLRAVANIKWICFYCIL